MREPIYIAGGAFSWLVFQANQLLKMGKYLSGIHELKSCFLSEWKNQRALNHPHPFMFASVPACLLYSIVVLYIYIDNSKNDEQDPGFHLVGDRIQPGRAT
jgi:hypothetical protein